MNTERCTVKSVDTLQGIAKRFFTSVDELVRLNSISAPRLRKALPKAAHTLTERLTRRRRSAFGGVNCDYFRILSTASSTPICALWKLSPPCSQSAYGSRSGASAESSIDAPSVNAPAAMIMSQS